MIPRDASYNLLKCTLKNVNLPMAIKKDLRRFESEPLLRGKNSLKNQKSSF